MKYSFSHIVFSVLLMSTSSFVFSQSVSTAVINGGGVITSGVPFLRIAPDARGGGMGDAGIAARPNANDVFYNPSKLAFLPNDFGVSLSFTPWLRSLVKDIYLANATGYYKIKNKQTVALSLRYLTLGNIVFTDENNNVINPSFRPQEFAIDGHYARRLGKYFSIAASLRFIYSNLANVQVNGIQSRPGLAVGSDVSFFFNKDIPIKKMNSNIAVGMNVSNIGSKIAYGTSTVKDFIPANVGIGVAWGLDINKFNQINFYVDMNKLLVPTPTNTDNNNNGIPDYREQSSIAAVFTSLGDAPGGAKEELQEINGSFAFEYWYNNLFAARVGYFLESRNKGNRSFLSLGAGVKYSVFGLDISYLVPTTATRNPLDNTFRFTLNFDFNNPKNKKNKKTPSSSKKTKKS